MRLLAVSAAALLAVPAGAATPAPIQPADDIVTYPIKQGDTLSGLGHAYLVPGDGIRTVRKLNRIGNIDRIPAGGTLKIPRRVLKDVQTLARVESFTGEVTMQPVAGAPVALAKPGGDFSEGSLVQTGRNSFVTLRLPDGTAIAIPSQSSVRLVRLRRVLLTGSVEREIGIDSGRARTRVTPMTDPRSSFMVRTPVTVSAVRGTEFGTAFDTASASATTQVEDGKVGFGTGAAGSKAPAGEVALIPGFGAAATAQGTTGPVPLLPPPTLIDPDKTQSDEALNFAVKPQAGAGKYRIQIGRDGGLLDTVAEGDSPDGSFSLAAPLPAGTYFARVSALDDKGIEGLHKTYAFDRVRNSVKGSMGASGKGRERQYLFKWDAVSDGQPLYRFQLANAAHPEAPIIDEAGIAGSSIAFTGLPRGEYSWRVLSIVVRNGKIIQSWSPEEKFEVAGKR